MDKFWRYFLYGSIVLITAAALFFTWLFWPYPQVTRTGDPVLVNLPERGYYQTGDVIRWVSPEVCQPAGVTTVTIHAQLKFPIPPDFVGTVNTKLVDRDFELPIDTCTENNPTSAYVDGNLGTGVYQLHLKVCTYNPSPRPKCETFTGPKVRVQRITGNEPPTIPPRLEEALG
jgi:hypothetical protein